MAKKFTTEYWEVAANCPLTLPRFSTETESKIFDLVNSEGAVTLTFLTYKLSPQHQEWQIRVALTDLVIKRYLERHQLADCRGV